MSIGSGVEHGAEDPALIGQKGELDARGGSTHLRDVVHRLQLTTKLVWKGPTVVSDMFMVNLRNVNLRHSVIVINRDRENMVND